MKSSRIVLFAVAATALASPAHAITWGEPGAGENPHVGTLLFVQNGEGYFSCTGTLELARLMAALGL